MDAKTLASLGQKPVRTFCSLLVRTIRRSLPSLPKSGEDMGMVARSFKNEFGGLGGQGRSHLQRFPLSRCAAMGEVTAGRVRALCFNEEYSLASLHFCAKGPSSGLRPPSPTRAAREKGDDGKGGEGEEEASSSSREPDRRHDDDDGGELQEHAPAHELLRDIAGAAPHHVPQAEAQHQEDGADGDR